MKLSKNKGLLSILIISYLMSVLPFLGRVYVQPTAKVWVQRSIHFYEMTRHGNFAETYTKYHPGVTLMWIVGIAYKTFYNIQPLLYGRIHDILVQDFLVYRDFAFLAKLFLVIFIGFILFFSFLILKRISGETYAFWTIFFIIFEPFVIGNIRSIHVDALVTFLMFLSFLIFNTYLFKPRKKYLFLAGAVAGLSLLTKISALVLFPFYAVSLLIFSKPKKAIKDFLVIIFISAFTFWLFFPAMWVAPIKTLQKIIYDGFLDTALKEESSRIFLNWETHSFKYKYISYFMQTIFRLTPLTLVFGLFGILYFVRKLFYLKKFQSRPLYILLLNALIFIGGYYLMISISDKKIFRYILPLYPFLALLAAYGVTIILRTANLLPVLIFVVMVFQMILIFPNFFAYFNPVLGGIKKASKVISLNQDGTGYYIVGDYLNKKPNAENLYLGCYDSGPMHVFFKGHSLKLKLYDPRMGKKADMDYILLPVQIGWEFLPKDDYVLEKVFRVNNINYWYLFRKIKT